MNADNGTVLVTVTVKLSSVAHSMTLPLFCLINTWCKAWKTGRKHHIMNQFDKVS